VIGTPAQKVENYSVPGICACPFHRHAYVKAPIHQLREEYLVSAEATRVMLCDRHAFL
jgi:hypothetical protein